MFFVFSGQNLNHADAWWALNADYIHHNHTDHFYDLIHMYPVYKVSIIPRGRALGVTMYLPEGMRGESCRGREPRRLLGVHGPSPCS